VREEKPTTRSAYSFQEWLAYANTQPDIVKKRGFANAMARTPDNDGVLELHLEIERQAQEPPPTAQPDCPLCRGTGWELVAGKGAKPCGCRPSTMKGLP
jgi:hypothetical protein